MQRIRAPRSLLAFLAAAVVALPLSAVPASASSPTQDQNRLDDEVNQHLQTTPESGLIPVIVEGASSSPSVDRAQRAENGVKTRGGRVVGSSSLLGASVAELTPAQIRALSADPSVGRIHFDAPVRASSQTDAPSSSSVSTPTPITFDQTIRADEAWKAGETGKGVTVAVLDTGIDTNASAFGGRVKARVDLVDPAHPNQGDPAGHGTHVAGIIAAGRSFASPGVAPDASLVSVRVLDDQGQARVSTVIEGLEWTIAHKEALGIRVVVLALSAPARASYRDDLLAAATEIAWHSGLVVVVAGGNGGPAAGSIASPAYDPLLLTVGAVDERGTRTTADDVIPAWSSQGPTVDGVAKPDLVAPGRKIVSVRVQGSTLDRLLPLHVETAQTFRLSGTSQAAAVSAGAAAVLLQQRDRLEPDEVKAILTHSTTHLNGATPGAAGAGEIDVARALATPVPPHAKQSVRPGNALLHLLEVVGPGVFEDVLDDRAKWDAAKWDAAKWDAAKWDAAKWDAAKWDAAKWDAAKWDAAKWDAAKWDTLALD